MIDNLPKLKIKPKKMNSMKKGGRCLAWYDASLGRWSSPVQIRPTP